MREALLYKMGYICFVVLLGLLFIASPVFALTQGNPANIDFGTGTDTLYKVFENVLETGDMLIVAEGFVDYGGITQNFTASQAFLFELLNTTGDVTLASTTLNDYGDRPVSIYLSNAQVTGLFLVSGNTCGIRIMGNPLIFASPVGNNVTAYLAVSDYVDQSVATDTNNPLRNFLIEMAENIETYDATPTNPYIITVQGVRYLTLAGGNIFQEGITGLAQMCPILFQSGVEPMSSDAPEHTGTYALTLTPAQKWGTTVANGLTSLGVYLGINQALAGSVMLFVLVIAFAVFVYQKTESGMTVLVMVAATPFMGAYLGLMPMALAFIFVIIIITLMGFFFFSRGAL